MINPKAALVSAGFILLMSLTWATLRLIPATTGVLFILLGNVNWPAISGGDNSGRSAPAPRAAPWRYSGSPANRRAGASDRRR